MKIKKKTELRKIIKDNIGTVGSLRNIWFFEDGEWNILYRSTCPNPANYINEKMPEIIEISAFSKNDKEITERFHDIENYFNKED